MQHYTYRPVRTDPSRVRKSAASRMTGLVAAVAVCLMSAMIARADTIPVEVLDANLQATTVIGSGLSQPIGIVFLGPSDFLVLEKASGQVRRVINGLLQPAPVLDLAVNSNSERGLLSMALHPSFPSPPPGVYPLDGKQYRRGQYCGCGGSDTRQPG